MNGGAVAGVACVDITPPVGVMLEAYRRTEPSTGIHDRLYASALVLARQRQEPFALVSVDNAALLVAETDVLRESIGAEVGIPRDRIMICLSHTHSGPRVTPEYLSELGTSCVDAVKQALAGARPVRVGWGVGRSAAAVNRRSETSDPKAGMRLSPRGVPDQRLGVLSLAEPDGRPLALLLWYGAHGAVLKGDSNVISADWPGAARTVVSAALGCPALVVIGAAGDVNPRWRGSLDALGRMGLAVGGEALRVVAGIETAPLTELRVCSQAIPLQLQPLPEAPEAAKRAAEAAAHWGIAPEPWLKAVDRCRARGEVERVLPLEVHLVRINEGIMGGIPMEPFTEIGLRVADRFPERPVLFGGCTNGWIGYLPTPEEYLAGGYEVDWAPLGHGTNSGWLTPAIPETAAEVVTAATEMISRLTE